MARYYYHGWTEDEDRRLAEIMSSAKQRRMKLDDLFAEAVLELGRTDASVRNRWYDIRKRLMSEAV